MRDSQIIVPMNVMMSKVDEEMFMNVKVADEVSTHDNIRLKPDILQNGENFFFPIFSSAEQIPEDYGSHFSAINLSVLQCIEMAKSYEKVCGLVLDAFTEPMVLEYAIADLIPQFEIRLAPEG
ncbi:MAG: SseB family protein [Eubacteriales bacterium]|nr:SseB family protein [Eubacteriales bacterium]